MAQTQGLLVYPLDDAYMHLTLARNLVEHGVFGFSPDRFSFASSSPLYTLSISAVMKLARVTVEIPIVINFLLGISLITTLFLLFQEQQIPPWLSFTSLCATLVLLPLPLMILSGMEHVMHALLVVLYLVCLSRMWESGTARPGLLFLTGTYAFLSTGTRYESVFLLGTSCLLLLIHRRFAAFLSIGAGTVLGFGLPGLYSLWHNGTFLPVSVLLKANVPGSVSWRASIAFLMSGVNAASSDPYLLCLMGAVLAGALMAQRLSDTFWNRYTATGVAWVGACWLHLQFARTGWVFRYEAYLIAGGLFLATGSGAFYLRHRRTSTRRASSLAYGMVFAFLLGVPFSSRAFAAWIIYPSATRNIYSQQVQMARFLAKYYPTSHVVLNDIGAVSFYTHAEIFDIFGLATPAVANAKRRGTYDTELLAQLADDAGSEIAIAYEHWPLQLPGGLPANWEPVGSWTIPKNVVCGSDTVTFFAIDPAQRETLKANLIAFNEVLPNGIAHAVR